jgi:hypothetical protein
MSDVIMATDAINTQVSVGPSTTSVVNAKCRPEGKGIDFHSIGH